MKNTQYKIIFSTIILVSMLAVVGSVNASPVKFKQVIQVVNAKPGKANTGTFSKLQLAGNPVILSDGDDEKDKDKKKKAESAPQQDGRVITVTTSEIAENEVCDCTEVEIISKGGFPKWTLFGLGAVPLAFIKTGDNPTPTPTTPVTTPTTATPTATTPPVTPEPTPEPMTLLLFGTGLAGVGFAARKKFGKKEEEKTEE